MKKLSTTAAREIGKLQTQQLTIGLDLGDRSSCYCVLDESGGKHPTCTERKKSDGRVATVATRRERKILSDEKQKEPT